MKTFSKTSSREFITGLTIILFLVVGPIGHAQSKSSSKPVKGYGKATYSLTTSGQFMHDWLVAGPIIIAGKDSRNPDDAAQAKFFNEKDILTVDVAAKKAPAPVLHDGQSLAWVPYAGKDSKVDFENLFGAKDFVSAYAMAEIVSDAGKKVILAFGSDDGIKVILNGKVVHSNWIPRGITADADVVPVTLIKGSNQLIVKVQDIQGEWGFTARILDSKGVADRLISASSQGNTDLVRQLIEAGANVNQMNDRGLTPWGAARIAGRSEVMNLLKANGATETELPSPHQLTDAEYAWLNDKKASGIALLVAKDGKIVYEKGFGFANIEKNERITPETKFRIGSITKQFIGAAILKLQEEGKISVHDKLSKFLPDFNKGDEVTIHHLLTHTSGIHSYTNRPDFVSKVTGPVSEDDLVALIAKEPYDFEPGDRFLYNNSGYFLLGHIIRKVTGKSFGEYLNEQFFKPIGMTATGVYDASLKLTHEAHGYKKENGEYKADINWDMSWAGGAGALYSTVRDLFLWNEAVFSGRVIRQESLNAAFTPVVLNNGKTPPEGKYGYGWGIGTYRGKEVVQHGGGLHGFSTRLARFPSENLTVVQLTNVIPTEVTLDPATIAEYFIWDKLDSQASYALKAVNEDVSQYTGRYDFGNGMVLTVTAQDQNLFAQVSGQGSFPIFPSAPGEYFWRVVEAKIKFVKNDKGEVTHGEFSQNGNNLNLVKMKDETIVSIDPALLENYVGVYDLGDNQVTVSKEDDKLFAQTKTSPRFEVKPLSNHEFTILELNAKLTFIREGDQKASKFILDMAGQTKDAPRIE